MLPSMTINWVPLLRWIASTSDLIRATLDSASFWEGLEYFAMALVLLGAIGETAAEFTSLRTSERWKRPTEIFSGMLIIVGLALEFPATMKTNSINSRQIADLQYQTQQEAVLAGRLGARVDTLKYFVDRKSGDVDTAIASLNSAEHRAYAFHTDT